MVITISLLGWVKMSPMVHHERIFYIDSWLASSARLFLRIGDWHKIAIDDEASLSIVRFLAIHGVDLVVDVYGHLAQDINYLQAKNTRQEYFIDRENESSSVGKLKIVIEDLRFLRDDVTTDKTTISNTNNNDKYNNTVPLIIFFHGGGMVLGRAPDPFGTVTASSVGPCILAHVDYRKSPEFPFPASAEDGYTALKYLVESKDLQNRYQYDINRIVLLGISAGGNLVVSTSTLARDRGLKSKIYLQIPIIPMLHYNLLNKNLDDTNSGILSNNLTKWFWYLFTAKSNEPAKCFDDPRCSPLTALKDYKNLPPAIVVTASADVLREEGKLYAQNLEKDGVNVTYVELLTTHTGIHLLDKAELYALIRTKIWGI